MTLGLAFARNVGTCRLDAKGDAQMGGPHESKSTDAGHRDGAVRKTLTDLARMFNNHIRGWINYYGRFYKSALYPTLRHIDRILARWAHRKFKSLRRHKRRTHQWLERVVSRQPDLFAHWKLLYGRGRTMGAG